AVVAMGGAAQLDAPPGPSGGGGSPEGTEIPVGEREPQPLDLLQGDARPADLRHLVQDALQGTDHEEDGQHEAVELPAAQPERRTAEEEGADDQEEQELAPAGRHREQRDAGDAQVAQPARALLDGVEEPPPAARVELQLLDPAGDRPEMAEEQVRRLAELL